MPPGAVVIDTTSRATGWSRGLSPFFLGPVDLYGERAEIVENAWQFSKVYAEHYDGQFLSSYWTWRARGFADKRAHRYPMGRGRKPLFTLLHDQKLGYVEARRQLYIPIYAEAVSKTEAFAKLKDLVSQHDVVLQDFDAYDHRARGMSWHDVVGNVHLKMGHAFVLAMMLEGWIFP